MTRPQRISRGAATSLAALFALVFVTFSVAPPAPAEQLMRQERARLTESAVGAEPLVRGESVRAAVALDVDEGLHVNANPPTYDYLIPIEISIEGPEGVEIARAFYPEAEHVTFPYAEDPLAVYERTVVIGVELEIDAEAPLGRTNLEISVRYQACNDRACFAPATATRTLPVSVAPAGTAIKTLDSTLLSRAPFPGS
jgi:thiol:disulfide interchange protein DsbD